MQRPLTGVRVLDLSQFLAGPYGSMLLGDLGAEVLKIEIPGKGDGSREMPPHFVHGQSGYFLSMNRSKKSMTLNLKSPAGLEIFYALVRQSDVVYDNFRPGILERLRIDYETLQQINPRIIACSVSGYGHTGPGKDRPAFDLVVQALGGIMSYTGPLGGEPVRMGAPSAIWPAASSPRMGCWPHSTSASTPARAAVSMWRSWTRRSRCSSTVRSTTHFRHDFAVLSRTH